MPDRHTLLCALVIYGTIAVTIVWGLQNAYA